MIIIRFNGTQTESTLLTMIHYLTKWNINLLIKFINFNATSISNLRLLQNQMQVIN